MVPFVYHEITERNHAEIPRPESETALAAMEPAALAFFRAMLRARNAGTDPNDVAACIGRAAAALAAAEGMSEDERSEAEALANAMAGEFSDISSAMSGELPPSDDLAGDWGEAEGAEADLPERPREAAPAAAETVAPKLDGKRGRK